MRNVFISFDADDEGMIDLLRMQAKDERFPFKFRDYSVKVPFEYGWKAKVRNLIHQSSAVIVAIGENTYRSKAVEWEIDEAHRQGKEVIGVLLHRDWNDNVDQMAWLDKIPDSMDWEDEITDWDTREIACILEAIDETDVW